MSGDDDWQNMRAEPANARHGFAARDLRRLAGEIDAKRDMDLIRALLLNTEGNPNPIFPGGQSSSMYTTWDC